MKSVIATALIVCLSAAPALAQDSRTRIGLGAQIGPDYPGADSSSLRPLFDFNRADDGEVFPFVAADDSFGPALIRSDGFSAGPSLAFQGKRKRSDTANLLPKVGSTIEAGGFAQIEGSGFRLRGEVRKGLGGHKGVVANLAADFVTRDADNWLFAIGPRVRLVNGRYNRAYFGVDPVNATLAVPAYRPDGGFGSIGGAANAVYALTPEWGLLGFVRYDRLTGDAKKSPVTRAFGDRGHVSGGVAVTYTFGGK